MATLVSDAGVGDAALALGGATPGLSRPRAGSRAQTRTNGLSCGSCWPPGRSAPSTHGDLFVRTFVRLVTLTALFLGVAFVHLPGAQAIEVPETLADRRPVGAGPVVPPFPIDYLGVLWDTPGSRAASCSGATAHGRPGSRSPRTAPRPPASAPAR